MSRVDLRGSIERARAGSGGRFPVRRAGRVHAALTALAFVLSSLFGLIHEGTTTHVRCAEHGELIDGGPAIASPTSGAPVSHAQSVTAGVLARGAAIRSSERRSREVQDDPRAREARDAIVTHGHEHCAMASAMRESRVVPRTPVVVPAPVAVGQLAAAPPLVAVARNGELYRTAPKTSPPV
jgi:hypothetical protein